MTGSQDTAEEIERALKSVSTDILKETLESLSVETKSTSAAALIAAYKEVVCEKGAEHLAHNIPADKLQEACKTIGVTSGDYKKKFVEGSKSKGLETFLKGCDEKLLREFAGFLKLDDGNKEHLEKVVVEEMMMTGMKALLSSLTPQLLKKYCTSFNLTAASKKADLVSSLMDHVFQLEPEDTTSTNSSSEAPTTSSSGRKGKKGKAKDSPKAEAKSAERKSPERRRGSTRSTEKKETSEGAKGSKRKASASPTPTRASARSSRKTTKDAEASPAKKRSSSAKPKAASPVKKSTRTSKASESAKSTETTSGKRKRSASPSPPPAPAKKENATKKAKTTDEAPAKGAERPPISDLKKGLTYTQVYDTWNATDLKDFCKEKGLKSSGKKPELIKRALEYLETGTVAVKKKKKKAPATKKKTATKKGKTSSSTSEKSATSTTSSTESTSGKKALNGSASSSKV